MDWRKKQNKRRQESLLKWKETQPHTTIKDAAIAYYCEKADGHTLNNILDAKTEATTDGCLEWKDACLNGYGAFTIVIYETTPQASVRVKAHRLTFALHYGFDALPESHKRGNKSDDLVIDHRCNNRGCVNPEHLQVITHKENLAKRKPAFTKVALELVA